MSRKKAEPLRADFQEILRALSLLFPPDDVIELRGMKTRKKTQSGYYDDHAQLAKDATRLDEQASGTYVVLNEINPDLLARSANRLKAYVETGETTSDRDITRRRYFPVDCDAVRPSGISSTDSQHEAALRKAQECANFLESVGFPEESLVVADSGNGGHVLAMINLPAGSDSTKLIQDCLKALDAILSDAVVRIDTSVFNPARIWKLYGTVARKGDSTQVRPYRRSRILKAPNRLMVAPRACLERLAALKPDEPKVEAGRQANANEKLHLEVANWLPEHGISVKLVAPWSDKATKYVLESCPFDPSHIGTSVAVFQFANGAISFKCFHNGCVGKTWADLRRLKEPGYRDRQHNQHLSQNDAKEPKAGLSLTPLASLLVEPEESVSWVWDKTLPSGGLSILAAKPKVGKSTLARNLAFAVSKGESFLERGTSPGPVVYLALEEKRSEVKGHFARMGAENELIFVHAGAAPEDAMEELRTAVLDKQAVLAIVDPLLRMVRVRDANDYAEVTRRLEPLLTLARETGCHVLAVHHLGKGEREGGDGILGSTALFAGVDTALLMKRKDTERTLESIQRYGEDVPKMVLSFDAPTGQMAVAGTVEVIELQRTAVRICEALGCETAGEMKLTEAQIREEVGGNTGLTGKALRNLREQGQVQREGTGKKGDPYRYFLVSRFPVYEKQEKQEKLESPSVDALEV